MRERRGGAGKECGGGMGRGGVKDGSKGKESWECFSFSAKEKPFRELEKNLIAAKGELPPIWSIGPYALEGGKGRVRLRKKKEKTADFVDWGVKVETVISPILVRLSITSLE